jgi:hypothetical protein
VLSKVDSSRMQSMSLALQGGGTVHMTIPYTVRTSIVVSTRLALVSTSKIQSSKYEARSYSQFFKKLEVSQCNMCAE